MKLLRIEKSPAKNKKYRADVEIDGVIYKNIDFGDVRHEQYRDSTPLKLYSHLDHGDKKRLKAYHDRHRYNNGPAGLLAKRYLW